LLFSGVFAAFIFACQTSAFFFCFALPTAALQEAQSKFLWGDGQLLKRFELLLFSPPAYPYRLPVPPTPTILGGVGGFNLLRF